MTDKTGNILAFIALVVVVVGTLGVGMILVHHTKNKCIGGDSQWRCATQIK